MEIELKRDGILIDILSEIFPDSSRSHIKKIIKFGCVSMGGAMLKHPEFPLKKGQKIEYRKYKAREIYREKAPFRILYEDDDMLVVYKNAGILSCGRTTENIRSMFSVVNSYVLQKTRNKQRAYTVHRLDREVCGLMIFAKTEQSRDFLKDNWQEVTKKYYAVVEGRVQKKSGTIKSYLKENSRQQVYSLTEFEEGAKHSITHYSFLEYYQDKDQSLLEVKLETGRKNQIRVHLSSIGHPIVGDRKYGADPSEKLPIHLVAYSLSFPQPSTGRRQKVEVGLPKFV